MRLSEIDTNSRHNNLNLIRLIAAISVTFSHSYPLISGNNGYFWGMNIGYLGGMAVAVFFSLSGFLITQSYLKNPNWKAFLEARCLRIFPGLFYANFVTILLVGFFVKKQGLFLFFDLNNIGYLFSATIFKFYHYSQAFSSLPFTSANGSLWTLPVEFRMYLFTLALGLLGALHRRLLTLIFFIALAILTYFHLDIVGKHIFPILFDFSGFDFSYLNLAACFGMGTIFCLFKEKVPINIPLALFAFILCFIFEDTYLRYLSLGYAAFVCGYHPKLYIHHLNFKDDLSYAIYVLSFPVQQTLVYTRATKDPITLFFLTMIIVAPLAIVSWRLVERPSLKLKGKWSTKKNA